jgi:hypothetical protein
MDQDRKQGGHGKAKKLQESTVEEAQAARASADDGDTFVWGTRQSGTKAEFEAFLASRDGGDAIVWGN